MHTYLLIGVALIVVVAIWKFSKSGEMCDAPVPKKLVLFYSEKCPACINFRPTWEKLKKNHEDDASIVFMEIDAEKNPDERIEGYPTIILDSPEGQFIFKDSRELEKLEAFISKN